MILAFIGTLVLTILFLLIVIPLISHLIDYNEDSKYGGLYTVECRYFPIKYLFSLILLKIQKYRKGGNPVKLFDIEEKRYHRQIEKPHFLNEEHSVDSVSFYCIGHACFETEDKNKIDVVIRFARKKYRISECWILIKQNDKPILVQSTYPDTAMSNCSKYGWHSIHGLSIYCDRPNEKWTVKYNGWMKEDTPEGKIIHVNLKLCFRSFTNIVDTQKEMSEELRADAVSRERWDREFFDLLRNLKNNNNTHYEQWGGYSGVIIIDKKKEYQLEHAKGYRDHSFGNWDWNDYRRNGSVRGCLDNGGCFNLGSVCFKDALTHVRYGYYITPFGDLRPITSHNFNLWQLFLSYPPKPEFEIEFVAGEKFKLEISRSSEATINTKGGKCILLNRFVNIKLNGISGRGINEFFTSEAVPRYKQPKPISIDILDRCYKSSGDSLCASLADENCRNRKWSGGKGSQLADLILLKTTFPDINVPVGFVVSTNAYAAFIKNKPDLQKHLNELSNAKITCESNTLESLCEDIKALIENGEISEELQREIIKQLQEIFGLNWIDESFAIRSSSIDEDSTSASSAGQMATYLNVKSLENIIEHIQKCWASQFTHTAVTYRIKNGQPINSTMAVVVMKMVPSNISGVLFTRNPLDGDSTMIVLNATFGLGEAIVSGKCNPDQYGVEKQIDGSLKIVSSLAGGKNVKMEMNLDTQGISEIVGNDENQLCLSDQQVLQLAKIGVQIEQSYGEPCDIEWAIHDEQIFILQTRPISSLTAETDQEIIQEFDSAISYEGECLTTSNIGEMLPKAATPLTLSLFGTAVDSSFQMLLIQSKSLSRILSIRRFLPSFSNHLFLNIHLNALLADIDNLDMLFISLLGRIVEKPTKEDIKRFTGTPSFVKKFYNRFIKIWTLKSYTENVKIWEKRFQCGYKIQVKNTAKRQMIAILDQIKDYFLCWFDTVENTCNSALWTLMLIKIFGNRNESNNDVYSKIASLLSTCSNVVSADIPSALRKISITIRRDEELRKFLGTNSDEACVAWFNSDRSKEAGKLFQQFLARHGHRCIREAEFQETSWRRSPEKFVRAIKIMVENLTEDDYNIKKDVSLDAAIDNIHLNLNFVKRKIVKWILEKARRGVSSREWGKSISIEMCEAFKLGFSKLSELMVKENIIYEHDLIYYFTFDELVAMLLDDCDNKSSIVTRAYRRRRVFQHQMKIDMPELCFGYPYGSSESDRQSQIQVNGKLILSGLPVSVGRVSGLCRVISTLEEASEIKPGEILIVPYTDVGWTPFFPLLAGLVTEKGSLLSHGAVVAREYGLPCLVSCAGATKIFQTGDHVLLNASEGSIQTCTK